MKNTKTETMKTVKLLIQSKKNCKQTNQVLYQFSYVSNKQNV